MQKKLVVSLMLLFLLIMAALSIRAVGRSEGSAGNKGDQVIGVIEINGFLGETGSTSVFTPEVASAEKIMEAIRQVGERNDIKAVVLRINSPGGTSVAAQEVGVELDRLRKTGKPIVTSMGDVCASGGYWVACSSDRIVANPSSLTGSIGVIMEMSNLEGLYNKLGIRQEVFKSGAYKDIGSPLREIKPEEREFLQAIVDDSYDQFLDQVEKGRKGKINREEIKKVADGRIMNGRHALQLGLVDSLGNYYEAIKIAQKMAGVSENSKVEVLNKTTFWDSLLADVRAPRILPEQGFWRLSY